MRDSSPRSRGLVVARLAAAVPPLLLALMGYRRRWTCDDAFIVFRVAGNLVSGHGPVFNLDERVEAYTSPAWLALVSLWRRLGGRLEAGAVALGLLFAVFGLIASQAGSARILRAARVRPRRSPEGKRVAAEPWSPIVPAGGLLLAALPPVWDFSTSGLEMGLVFGWLGATFWSLAALAAPGSVSSNPSRLPDTPRPTHPPPPPDASRRTARRPFESAATSRFAWARPSRWDAVAILAGIGPLVRPELALFSAAFLIALLVCRAANSPAAATTAARAWRRLVSAHALRLIAGALLLPLAYELFRMGYFATLVANSALAKEPGAANWSRGWAYLRDLAGTYALWIPALALFAVAWAEARSMERRERAIRAVLWAPVVGALLHTIFVVRLGGDFMHARMLLPALWGAVLPVAMVALPVAGESRNRSGRRRRRSWQSVALWSGWLVVAAWAVCCATTLRLHYGPRNDGPVGITDERGFYVREARRPHPIASADFIRVTFAADGMGLWDFVSSSGAPEVAGSTGATAGPRGLLIDTTDSPVKQRLSPGEVRLYPLSPAISTGVRLVVGRWNVGLTGYFAGPRVHLVDRHGLADALAARLRRQPGGRPGHDKILRNDWMVARFSTVEPSGPNQEAVAAARHALQCRPLSDLFAAIQEPLTFRRFAANVALAVRLQRLRVPPDPVAAERELCTGAGS